MREKTRSALNYLLKKQKDRMADLEEKFTMAKFDLDHAREQIAEIEADLAEDRIPKPAPEPERLEIIDAIMGHDKPFVDSVTTAEPPPRPDPSEPFKKA